MEPKISSLELLYLIGQPGFCVQGGIITHANSSARHLHIELGSPISDLMVTGLEEYKTFSAGSMYLTIVIHGERFGASATRIDGYDIFLLEEDIEKIQLRTASLAAQALREPMYVALDAANQLTAEKKADQKELATLQRGLYRILRLVTNMADAARYTSRKHSVLETCNLTAFFNELMGTMDKWVTQAGRKLHYSGISQSVFCLANTEQLERAVYNMVSNAVKFSPADSEVRVRLIRRGNHLYLTVEDSGKGIPEDQWRNVFFGFQREPDVADGLQGIGLGMVLIRAAATSHGGTVLVEQPEKGGSRITLSIEIRQNNASQVKEPALRSDYLGELDHGLIELADLLPPSAFK